MNEILDNLVLHRLRLEAGEAWFYRRDALWIGWISSGEGRCQSGSEAERFQPGEVLVTHGGEGIRMWAGPGAALEMGWFTVQIEQLFPLFASAELALLQYVASGFDAPRRHGIGSHLGRVMESEVLGLPEAPNLEHRSRLLRVVAAMLTPEIESARASGMTRPDRAEVHFRKILAAISEEDLIHLPVEELAARFGCSRRHLNRLFHQYTGDSLAAMRMEMRLRKAESLLRDPRAKVIQVAGDCGFAHLSQFNSCFKRRFGDSPGRWRKRSESEPLAPAKSKTGTPFPGHGSNGSGGATPWNAGVGAGTSGLADSEAPRQAAA
ncbi:MAG: helix-turn-helix transcriptional regulator [Verrucomicrobiae bacterium]|nr:helix-turn-helix transcriptional regulator [Verrucomicrobiae bacterium]